MTKNVYNISKLIKRSSTRNGRLVDKFNNFDSELWHNGICDDTAESLTPVPLFKLFRFATWIDLLLIFLGVYFGLVMGCCVPGIIIIYGEYITILVDRNMENITSTPTTLLKVFGGGYILENGTHEERFAYLLEDAAAAGTGCAVLGAICFICGSLSISCLNYAAQSQIERIRKVFLKAVMSQDMAWCDTHNTSAFASRLTEDLDKMLEGIGEKIGVCTFLFSSFGASVIMALYYGWKLTLVVLSLSPIIIISTAVAMKVQTSLATKETESYAEAGSVVEEVLTSIRTIIAFGGEKTEIERYTEKLKQAESAGIKRGLYSGLGSGILWLISYTSYFITFIYGIELILGSRESGNTEYTPAVLAIVLFGVLVGAMNIGYSAPHLEAFAMACGSAAAVFNIVDQTSEINTFDMCGLKPDSMEGNISLENVQFSYPSRPQVQVLKGLTLHIKRGETVALVGSSGCGKSTVIQLVQRLYDPSGGMVCIDGTNVKDLNVSWLRSHIGVVGQEPVLFETTIAENIRYGRENATQREIEIAAEKANAHSFISKLPDGYDTVVGQRGAQLSGGQKQRIAIARALIRNPTILLLDEATSALDVHSEAKVQDALDNASEGRTTIIVAHRLSTIKNADRIIYISSGQVVEDGTHESLMALRGYYWSQITAEISNQTKDTENESNQQEYSLEKSVTRKGSKHRHSTVSLKKTTGEECDLKEDDNVSISRIMGLTKPEWLYNLVGCLSSVVVGSTYPSFAVIFGEIYRILSLTDEEEIRHYGRLFSSLFVVLGVACGLAVFLQTYSFGKSGVNLTTRLRITTFTSILKQEMGWFDEESNSVGTLCARLSGDASSVQGATGTRIGIILQSLCTLLIGAVISVCYSWEVTLICLVVIPVVMAGMYFDARIIRLQAVQEKDAIEKATKIAVEAISNLRTVASLGAEHIFINQYEKELSAATKATRMKTRLRGPVFALGEASLAFGYAVSFYFGGIMVVYKNLPYDCVIKISEALIFGAWMLGESLAFAQNITGAELAAGRLFKIIDRKPKIASSESGDIMRGDNPEVKYSRIKFSYPTRPGVPILQGLDLLVQPGKNVALVGPSGCGKSTCIQLLQRFYDPDDGKLTVDGTNTQSVSLPHLRSKMGLVSQEPTLFDRTIAENIAYGDNDREVSMPEIIEAAKKANIHNFISGLPLGYNTRLGAKGAQLSGGQKQRVAIARALVRNPRILLLDEATSALDTQSQKVVQEALDQAQEGRTCITITHRLVTIRQADVICVLNQGVVAEMGSHSELVEKRGLYFKLLNQTNKQQ